MDVFKTRPGIAESIMISRDGYLRITGGALPYCVRNAGRVSYYAVCPYCDNPIQIVGMNKQEGESRPVRPYGRHCRGDVPGLARYDHDAYMHCLYTDPNHVSKTAKRRPKDPTGIELYRIMRDRFDHVVWAWETYSGIHLSPAFAEHLLRLWRGDEGWRYYHASYGNLPQMLLYGCGAWSLVKRYIVQGSPIEQRLAMLPQVRLDPTNTSRWAKVMPANGGYLRLDFMLYARDTKMAGEHLTETFRLCVMLGDGTEANELVLESDRNWLEHETTRTHGRRDERYLEISRRILD